MVDLAIGLAVLMIMIMGLIVFVLMVLIPVLAVIAIQEAIKRMIKKNKVKLIESLWLIAAVAMIIAWFSTMIYTLTR